MATIIASGTGISTGSNQPVAPGLSGPSATIVNGDVKLHNMATKLLVYATGAPAVIKLNECLIPVHTGANFYEEIAASFSGFTVISGTIDFVAIAGEDT